MIQNSQPIEKRVSREDLRLDVHSIFFTIQGEGPFCGTPAVFVRLAGCNLQCPFCDTEYTKGRRLMSRLQIIDAIADTKLRPGGLVVITGGEPFRQDLGDLLNGLINCGFYVQVETNGTLPPSKFGRGYSIITDKRSGVYIVCSPKSGKVNPQIWDEACCAKYVMSSEDTHADGLPIYALGHPANPYLARPPVGWDRPIYLQPMDAQDVEANLANIQAVRDSCMEHGFILQLQIHKLIGVE